MNWPIGMGKFFKGVYDLYNDANLPYDNYQNLSKNKLHSWVKGIRESWPYDDYMDEKKRKIAVQAYYGMCSFMDSNVGKLLTELKQCDINIHMTGGETADVGDLVRTIIVDSTVVARIKKDEVIDNSKISAGNVIVGLASYGKATYESNYNGGMGSNGLTSARHDVFNKILAEKYPESYDNDIPEELVYTGTKKLTEKLTEMNIDAGKLVLSPTRTYAPVIKKIINSIAVSYTHLTLPTKRIV